MAFYEQIVVGRWGAWSMCGLRDGPSVIAKRIQFDRQVGMADIPELTRNLLRGYFLGFKYTWISAPGAMFGAILTIVSLSLLLRDSIRYLQQQLKQQDEGLDMLSKSADRLGALSLGISEELGQQNK